ncbi:HAD family hydrolase [Bacillus sp. JCM 19034]|uniref:HAD family hydrolase n=1 Tax=Bacillus sp. JCM 19034 TaxID=1481928 RepID=UPI0007818D10|nr:HAD hydrolase-like protein [Bacillus sp. JCM 19034]
MDNIKGILFDKDGTLIEFFSLWEKIALGLVADLANGEDPLFQQELLASIGLVNGQITANSILAGGTTKDIADAFYPLLLKESCQIPEPFHQWVEKRILQLTKDHLQVIQPITDLKKLLKQLKDDGLKLGVATADDQETTTLTFQMLGIDHYFDFIGTSDHYEKNRTQI